MNNDNLKKTITKFVTMAILEADELPFVETAEYVASELIAAGLGDVKEAEHRAEVAEKALKKFAAYTQCFHCPFSDNCKIEQITHYSNCFDEYLQQAEKELSEERKDEV